MTLIRSWTFMYRHLIRKKLWLEWIMIIYNWCLLLSFWIEVLWVFCVACLFRVLQMRSCAYYPRYGFGAFGVFPLLLKNRCVLFDDGGRSVCQVLVVYHFITDSNIHSWQSSPIVQRNLPRFWRHGIEIRFWKSIMWSHTHAFRQ
jgi:hypothetical protein